MGAIARTVAGGRAPLVGAAILLLAACGSEKPDPSTGLRFRDATREFGLPEKGMTYGAAITRLPGSDETILLLGRHAWPPALYRLGTRPLEELSPSLLGGAEVADHHATVLGDFDRDGAVDIYLVAGAERGRGVGENVLALWEQDRWVPAASSSAVADPLGRGRGGLAMDLRGDGRTDLLVLNFKSYTRLFTNDDSGTWRDEAGLFEGYAPGPEAELLERIRRGATAEEERLPDRWAHAAVPLDVENDGTPELLLFGSPPFTLYRRSEGFGYEARFSALPPEVHIPPPAAACVADFDGDGFSDIFLGYGEEEFDDDVVATRRNRLLLNRDGVFVESEQTRSGTLSDAGVWCVAADFDNDGDADLFLSRRMDEGSDAPNFLFENRGGGEFVDRSEEIRSASLLRGASESALAHDFDGDGDLDLLLLQGAFDGAEAPGGVFLLENESGPASWIELELEGARPGDPPPFGSIITVRAAGLEQNHPFWPTRVGGCSMALPLHIGLGKAGRIDELSVRWPDGSRGDLGELEMNRRHRVRAPASL